MDYQFCQTSKNSFEMIAEIAFPEIGETVSREMKEQMQTLLRKNGLSDVDFSIRFVKKIMPDRDTGKKSLIVVKQENTL